MVYQNDIAINMDPPSDNTSTGHAQLTEEPEKVDVLSVDIASSTKDSVRVKWRILQDYVANVQGFEVSYQAVGSHVIQVSPRLSPTELDYDIQKLHEDTVYHVCVKVATNMTLARANEACLEASTSTDSLHVALGSAFGAFFALGIVVFFVFLAKWRHNNRRRKRMQKFMATSSSHNHSNGDVMYSRDMHDVDYASNVSMQVNDDEMKLSELGSQLDDCDAIGNCRDFPAQIPELSDCSEEPLPHSFNSGSFLGMVNGNGSHGSYERCCQCDNVNLSAESFMNRSDISPRSMRSSRNLRQQSVESSRSLGIPRQQSIGSYNGSGRPKRASLRKQRSMDSSRSPRGDMGLHNHHHRSRDSGLYSSGFPVAAAAMRRQKSQDSGDYSGCESSPGGGFDNKRSHRSRGARDNNELRPMTGSGNLSRSRSPLDGYRSDRSFDTSPSPIAQMFQVVSNPPQQNNGSPSSAGNPFQNADGRPADVRPKYSNSSTVNGTHLHASIPVNDTKLVPIPTIDIVESNSEDSGLVLSPPETKLEFGSMDVHDEDAQITNMNSSSNMDPLIKKPQTNLSQNEPLKTALNTDKSNLNNPPDNELCRIEIPEESLESKSLESTNDCHDDGTSSKTPLAPKIFSPIATSGLQIVNDGGHSNGLRPNNSCPNW